VLEAKVLGPDALQFCGDLLRADAPARWATADHQQAAAVSGLLDPDPVEERRGAQVVIDVGGHAVQVRAAVGMPTGHDLAANGLELAAVHGVHPPIPAKATSLLFAASSKRFAFQRDDHHSDRPQ
jgi:hypothetical protein